MPPENRGNPALISGHGLVAEKRLKEWWWAQSGANLSPVFGGAISLIGRENIGNLQELSLNHTFHTLYEADFISTFGRIP